MIATELNGRTVLRFAIGGTHADAGAAYMRNMGADVHSADAKPTLVYGERGQGAQKCIMCMPLIDLDCKCSAWWT